MISAPPRITCSSTGPPGYQMSSQIFTPITMPSRTNTRSEEHTSELQSQFQLVCGLLLEKKKHFLEKESPRGMSFADTNNSIFTQGALVSLPHPFDRLHDIPNPVTIHLHLSATDAFEVYN